MVGKYTSTSGDSEIQLFIIVTLIKGLYAMLQQCQGEFFETYFRHV